MRPKTIIALAVLIVITIASLLALKVAYNRVRNQLHEQRQ